MYGKSIFVMIIGWADRSSAFSSSCVWTWNGRWCRLHYQSLYSRRLGRWTSGHLNSFLGAKLDIYTIRTLNSITLWQLTIWNGGKLASCRAANKLVINNFLARTGLDIFMGWSVQDYVVFVDSARKGNEGVTRRMNHPVQLKIPRGVLFNWYSPKCFKYNILG